jgi:alpha-1,3-rhamnosyltransferase
MNSYNYTPLVSVVVVTYNSFHFVVETLESIKSQTYTNIELIISDDCSTDETVRLCRNWIDINDGRFVRAIVLTSDENTGIPANCNRGIIAARGEWIKLIAGDDLLIDSCISNYVSIIQDNDSLVFFSNVERYVDDFSDENKLKLDCFDKYIINQSHLSVDDQFRILLRVNNIFTASLFYSKKLFDLVGVFDESLRYWKIDQCL